MARCPPPQDEQILCLMRRTVAVWQLFASPQRPHPARLPLRGGYSHKGLVIIVNSFESQVRWRGKGVWSSTGGASAGWSACMVRRACRKALRLVLRRVAAERRLSRPANLRQYGFRLALEDRVRREYVDPDLDYSDLDY